MLGEEARQGRGSFFGRRKGKALRPAQRHALETVLPPLLIDISAPAPNPISALFPTGATDLRLEIGFGGGEHLVSEALAHPAVGFIGIEPFENGLAKVAAAIARHGIRNVRIFSRDATLLLDWLPPEVMLALPYIAVIAALALSGRNVPYPGAYLKPYRRA